jgi:hypothetical protein
VVHDLVVDEPALHDSEPMKIEDQTADDNSLERDSDTNIVSELPSSPVDKVK